MLSVKLVAPEAGTRPVVRNVVAAAGAPGPATVVWRKRPGMRATFGKSRSALGESPRLDQSVAVNTCPTLLTSLSWKMPKPARTTPLGLYAYARPRRGWKLFVSCFAMKRSG
jgi:hypothetical protein